MSCAFEPDARGLGEVLAAMPEFILASVFQVSRSLCPVCLERESAAMGADDSAPDGGEAGTTPA